MDPYKGQQAYVVGLRTLLEIPRFTTACSHDHDCNIKVHDSRPRLCKIPGLAAWGARHRHFRIGRRVGNMRTWSRRPVFV